MKSPLANHDQISLCRIKFTDRMLKSKIKFLCTKMQLLAICYYSSESIPALQRSKQSPVAACCKVRYLIYKPGERWQRIAALYEPRWTSVVWAQTHVSGRRAMVRVRRWWTRTTKIPMVASMRMWQKGVDGMWGWWRRQWIVEVTCSIPKVQLQLLLFLKLQLTK